MGMENDDIICHHSDHGEAVLIPHPYDCAKFYICFGSTPVLKECPSGLWFDSFLKVCNYPSMAHCEANASSTTPEPGTTTTTEVTKTTEIGTTTTTEAEQTTTTDDDISVVCEPSEDGLVVLIPHPYDCTKFFICQGTLGYMMQCPAGLWFDAYLKVCDYPDHAQCVTTTMKSSVKL